jgi:hypothetical protein
MVSPSWTIGTYLLFDPLTLSTAGCKEKKNKAAQSSRAGTPRAGVAGAASEAPLRGKGNDKCEVNTKGGAENRAGLTARPAPMTTTARGLRFASELALGYAIEAIQRVWEFADEEDEGGGLGIGFGAALLPFFEGAFIDAQLAGEDGARAAQAAARVANELGVHFG